MCCWNRRSLPQGTMIAAHLEKLSSCIYIYIYLVVLRFPLLQDKMTLQQNDPAVAAYLCSSGVIVIEHCASGVMTSCTLYCWARFSFSVIVIVVTGFIFRDDSGLFSL